MDELPIREKTSSEQPSDVKRLASLDFQRGLAIWIMVFLHVFNHMIDYSFVDINQLFSGVPPYDYFRSTFFVFVGYFANWIGYFIIISAIVNAYATTKKALLGVNIGRLFGKQILSGIGILLAGVMAESFGYYGYFGSVIGSGNFFQRSAWTDPANIAPIWERFFLVEALQIIGWCMIITAIIQYFLFIKGGAEKLVRNIIILGSLTLAIFLLSPVIWHLVDNMNWEHIPGTVPTDDNYYWPNDELQAYNHSFASWILAIIAGDYYPLFPFLGTTLLGAVIGTALAMPKPNRRLPLWGLILTIGLFVLGGIGLLLGESTEIKVLDFEISFERPSFGFNFFLLGGQVGVITLLFYLIDWRGKSEKFAKNIVVKYFRTWGMIALTIFALQIWSYAPRAVFNWTTPIDLVADKLVPPSNDGIAWIFAFVTILFYDLLIWPWAQINFVGSYEWMIIKFSSLASKQPSDRLNFKRMIRNTDWMNYKPLIPPKKVKQEEIQTS